MKKLLACFALLFAITNASATVHTVHVWDGYFQFIDMDNGFSNNVDIQLGDTVEWLPLDIPMMAHTITSSNIPVGAATFDYLWQAPSDTFFRYVPTVLGLHEYVCTPHAVSHNMVGSINVMPSTNNITEITQASLLVYPNPVEEELNVMSPELNGSFTVFDNKGVLQLKGVLTEKIDVSKLPVGVYHLHLEGDIPKSAKFIKQ